MGAVTDGRGPGPARAPDAIRWPVHPPTVTGAQATALPAGELRYRLPHLQRWPDHLPALGCNGLALGPVLAGGTHGYDTVDHVRVDPRLGDDADLVTRVKTPTPSRG